MIRSPSFWLLFPATVFFASVGLSFGMLRYRERGRG
jgi:hypothetical protein